MSTLSSSTQPIADVLRQLLKIALELSDNLFGGVGTRSRYGQYDILCTHNNLAHRFSRRLLVQLQDEVHTQPRDDDLGACLYDLH